MSKLFYFTALLLPSSILDYFRFDSLNLQLGSFLKSIEIEDMSNLSIPSEMF